MNCPNCKKEVSPEWELCPWCGYKAKKCSNLSCPNPNEWLPQEAKFCPSCGNKLIDIAEKRSQITHSTPVGKRFLRKGRYSIDKEKCKGCSKCLKQCPDDRIVLTEYNAPGHQLASYKITNCYNYECSSCYDSCVFNAITLEQYIYIQKGFCDISEQNRHAIYEHYIGGIFGVLFSSLFKIESGIFGVLFSSLFKKSIEKCIEEMFSFHLFMGYEQFDKSREDYLLAEWIIDHDKIPTSLLTKIVSRYNENKKESLAHFIYEARTKAGLA